MSQTHCKECLRNAEKQVVSKQAVVVYFARMDVVQYDDFACALPNPLQRRQVLGCAVPKSWFIRCTWLPQVSNWAVVRPASAVPWQTCVPGMSFWAARFGLGRAGSFAVSSSYWAHDLAACTGAPQELAAARGHCLGMESSAKSDSRSSPPVIQAAVQA